MSDLRQQIEKQDLHSDMLAEVGHQLKNTFTISFGQVEALDAERKRYKVYLFDEDIVVQALYIRDENFWNLTGKIEVMDYVIVYHSSGQGAFIADKMDSNRMSERSKGLDIINNSALTTSMAGV